MPNGDLSQQLQEAIALAQAGRRDEARDLLKAIVAADPTQELAWLWLASVSGSRAERITYLERALALNPDNPTSQQAYRELTGRSTPPPRRPGAPARGGTPPVRPGSILVWLAIALIIGLAVLLVIMFLTGDDEDAGDATPTLAPEMLTPGSSDTPRFTPTPSDTPRPTVTPGPSPTPVTLPPTWTPAHSDTPLPTQTLVPSWTPRPTRTPLATAVPPTATFTLLPENDTPTDEGEPSPLMATGEATEETR